MSWCGDILKGCFTGGTFSIIPRYEKGNKHRNRFGISSCAASEIDSSSPGRATPIRAHPLTSPAAQPAKPSEDTSPWRNQYAHVCTYPPAAMRPLDTSSPSWDLLAASRTRSLRPAPAMHREEPAFHALLPWVWKNWAASHIDQRANKAKKAACNMEPAAALPGRDRSAAKCHCSDAQRGSEPHQRKDGACCVL